MRILCKRKFTIRYFLLLIVLLCLIIFLFSVPNEEIEDEFDYSTVIYPLPFDKDHTNFFIYLQKKTRLVSNEDQISLSKQHKILDTSHREIKQGRNSNHGLLDKPLSSNDIYRFSI